MNWPEQKLLGNFWHNAVGKVHTLWNRRDLTMCCGRCSSSTVIVDTLPICYLCQSTSQSCFNIDKDALSGPYPSFSLHYLEQILGLHFNIHRDGVYPMHVRSPHRNRIYLCICPHLHNCKVLIYSVHTFGKLIPLCSKWITWLYLEVWSVLLCKDMYSKLDWHGFWKSGCRSMNALSGCSSCITMSRRLSTYYSLLRQYYFGFYHRNFLDEIHWYKNFYAWNCKKIHYYCHLGDLKSRWYWLHRQFRCHIFSSCVQQSLGFNYHILVVDVLLEFIIAESGRNCRINIGLHYLFYTWIPCEDSELHFHNWILCQYSIGHHNAANIVQHNANRIEANFPTVQLILAYLLYLPAHTPIYFILNMPQTLYLGIIRGHQVLHWISRHQCDPLS